MERTEEMGKKPLIGIVEDNAIVREVIGGLIRSAGYKTALFESAEAFLSSGRIDEVSCLTMDIQLPGMSGLELQRRLAEIRSIPIIVISSSDDSREIAKKQGAAAV